MFPGEKKNTITLLTWSFHAPPTHHGKFTNAELNVAIPLNSRKSIHDMWQKYGIGGGGGADPPPPPPKKKKNK